MPKTSKITFNVNDLQRQYTGQKRCYDKVGSWRYFAIERYQGLLKVYTAGVSDMSIVMTGSVFDRPAKTIIGELNASARLGFNGRLSNFRIRKGAVHKGNFTPLSGPFIF